MHIILLGDFNEIIDPHLDCTNPTHSRKDNSLITYLLTHDYIDMYRELHSHTAGFTYTRPLFNYGSRIDYIWISPNLANSITKADILTSNTITKELEAKSTNIAKATLENNYQADKIWSLLKESILQIANRNLKKQKFRKGRQNSRPSHHNNILKNTHLTGQIYRKYRRWLIKPQERSTELEQNIINLVTKLNKEEKQIFNPPFPQDNTELPQEGKEWLTSIHNIWRIERRLATNITFATTKYFTLAIAPKGGDISIESITSPE
ncbi:11434_t:CDS:2 [Acaulospora morrowiae]|uniref:11434_t:CDS:1 n=1 Tax=Acaulospora morrowiae TaxID=94023 RepID=A0A9N9AWK0_9GLOM|nr:11434_t:CDS:2 [Acaulospora morrowiae]